MKVFDHFDRIRIINLAYRSDRRREMDRELAAVGLAGEPRVACSSGYSAGRCSGFYLYRSARLLCEPPCHSARGCPDNESVLILGSEIAKLIAAFLRLLASNGVIDAATLAGRTARIRHSWQPEFDFVCGVGEWRSRTGSLALAFAGRRYPSGLCRGGRQLDHFSPAAGAATAKSDALVANGADRRSITVRPWRAVPAA